MAQGFGTSPEAKTYPLRREKEGGSSPHRRPHQSTKRTPSLYYRNSYETAPRKKNHTQEGKNNKVTHTQTYSFLFVRAPGAGAGKARTRLEHSLAARGSWWAGKRPSLQGSQDWLCASAVSHPHPVRHTFPNLVTLCAPLSRARGSSTSSRFHFLPVPSSPRHPSIGSHSQPGPRASPDFPTFSNGQRVPRS